MTESHSGLPRKLAATDPVTDAVQKALAEKYDRKIEQMKKALQELESQRHIDQEKLRQQYNECYAQYKSAIVDAFYRGDAHWKKEFDSQPPARGKNQWVRLDHMVESAMKCIAVEFQRDGYEASFLPAHRECYSNDDGAGYGSNWSETYMLFDIKFV